LIRDIKWPVKEVEEVLEQPFFTPSGQNYRKGEDMEFYIVGSALSEKEPRDVDMYGVMKDSVFKAIFGMTATEFEEQRSGGKAWGPELTKWKDETLGAIRVLQFVFPQLMPLDFKYLPESLLQEPYRKIDIRSSPESWGIGLPNLERHGMKGVKDHPA